MAAELPAGWTRHELGTKTFYYHAATNMRSDTFPVVPPVAAPAPDPVQALAPANRISPMLIEDERAAVKAGGQILEQNEDVFPDSRKCRDVIFSLAFIVVAGLLVFFAYKETNGFKFDIKIDDANKLPLACMASALAASCIASCILAFIFVHITRVFTKAVVWVSLLLTPCLLLVAALAALAMVPAQPAMIAPAGVFAFIGLCSLMCVLCCWRKLIPFTVEVLKPVATVLGHKPSLMFIAVLGTIFVVAWSLLAFCAFLGIFEQMQKDVDDNKQTSYYGYYFVTMLVFGWGALVVQNTVHVTNCGVFGRSYFGMRESVRSSLKVAAVTSFGSVCFGSLIIAFVQACEVTVRAIRRAAQREGNIVTCIILCVVECFIACIREIVEAFSYFAYVQVAVRGLSFCDSAKLTFALCKFKNIFYIVSVSLVGNVVFLGSLFCGILSGLAGCGVGYFTAPKDIPSDLLQGTLAFNFAGGVVAGIVVAATILNVLRSGFATTCVCWAEAEDRLAVSDQALHDSFQQRARMAVQ